MSEFGTTRGDPQNILAYKSGPHLKKKCFRNAIIRYSDA